jgi:hypothetical protein
MKRLLLALFLLFAIALPAGAHEVRPAYLEVVETEPGLFAVTWKQPVLDGRRLKLDPVFPEGCTRERDRAEAVAGTLIQRWDMRCDLSAGHLAIDGLERTLTDAFVRVDRLTGDDLSAVLRPGALQLNLSAPTGAPTTAYFRIGVEHIIFGYDHLLFVLGLILLVRPRQLLTTVTAFTIAHSITLAAASLGGISLPGPPVEIIIAMSIYRSRGRETLSQRKPWLIAFGFGLVHGFGFAGALSEIGLPKGAELLALLLFNLGVEAGQVTFVCAVLLLVFLTTRLARLPLVSARNIAAYAIGIIGTYWAIERIVNVLV